MTERYEDAYMAALAGLLHDIGKFAQRAYWPEAKGQHAEVGGEIVRRFVPRQWRKACYPVMGHHDDVLPDHATRVVALADWLSAGERVSVSRSQPRQLLSIFCRVSMQRGAPPAEHYWPLQPLALDKDALFPTGEQSDTSVLTAYQALWKGCENDLAILAHAHDDDGDLAAYLESLQLILQRYTWCVPSAYYRSVPDISLYDHSRMTAALAACLIKTPDDAVAELLAGLRHTDRTNKGAGIAVLVGCDISGVQDFIYTVTARGATSALRGRSFYLQLLTEAVARYLLRALDLPVTNLIYQGGGNVYLLAPVDAVTRLRDAQQEISRVLLRHHRGDLYVALAWERLCTEDFFGGRIGERWDDVSRRLLTAKQQRFAELGDGLHELFEPQGEGGNAEGQCQVCGREHPQVTPGDGVQKCAPCQAFERLGEKLRNAKYFALTLDAGLSTQAVVGTWQAVLADLGLQAEVSITPPKAQTARGATFALEDEALEVLAPTSRMAVGRRFLVNVTPIITAGEIAQLRGEVEELPTAGSVKPFSAMAAQARGIKRLGILRMDVDDLGTIFAEGLREHASLSRIAGLSFAVSLFFEGWVASIAREISAELETEQRGDTLYSIYSGGDDLFFVGAWDAVVRLAQRIRADLAGFVCQHPDIHVSGGIALTADRYPLYRAAQDAGEAEHEAKALRWYDADGREHRKDALSFLGVALPWQRFGYGDGSGRDPQSEDTASALCRILTEDQRAGGNHAVIRTLLKMHASYQDAVTARADRGLDVNLTGEPQVLWGPWIWQGYYRLMRHGDLGKSLARRFHDNERWFGDISWIGLAARWAELLMKQSR